MKASQSSVNPLLRKIEEDGFAVVAAVFCAGEVAQIQADLCQGLMSPKAALIRSESAVVGARNLLESFPGVTDVWRRQPLVTLLTTILGHGVGLVRALYFDKPPEQSWSLPWHKDLTIAVKDNRRPSGEFSKPTLKGGVPHVEASRALLEAMLFARIHLDDVTDGNGPMTVIPGSHRTGKTLDIDEASAQKVLCRKGDVLLIRPLVAHNSLGCQAANQNHRRVLHIEFAACDILPDGYEWYSFVPVHS